MIIFLKGYIENPTTKRHHSILRLTSPLGGDSITYICEYKRNMN